MARRVFGSSRPRISLPLVFFSHSLRPEGLRRNVGADSSSSGAVWRCERCAAYSMEFHSHLCRDAQRVPFAASARLIAAARLPPPPPPAGPYHAPAHLVAVARPVSQTSCRQARSLACSASRKDRKAAGKSGGGGGGGGGGGSDPRLDVIRDQRQQQLAASDVLAKLMQAEDPMAEAPQYVDSLDEQVERGGAGVGGGADGVVGSVASDVAKAGAAAPWAFCKNGRPTAFQRLPLTASCAPTPRPSPLQFFWTANTYLTMAKKEGEAEVVARLEAALKAAFEAKQVPAAGRRQR